MKVGNVEGDGSAIANKVNAKYAFIFIALVLLLNIVLGTVFLTEKSFINKSTA